jgi:hypothetical protein
MFYSINHRVSISIRKPARFHKVGKLTMIDRVFYQS